MKISILKSLLEKIKIQKRATSRYIEYRRLKRIRKKTIPPYIHCKNCGEELHGIYCSRCGQYALDINQGIGAYFKQFFENTYQFDGRIMQTMRFLLFRPGFLTNEFIKGKINSYVHPMKLFMFLSVIFFGFILLLYSHIDIYESIKNFDKEAIAKIENSAEMSASEKSEALKSIDSLSTITMNLKPYSFKDEHGKTQNVAQENYTRQRMNFFYRELFARITKYIPIILLFFIPLYGWIMRKSMKNHLSNFVHNMVFSFHIHSFILTLISLGVIFYQFFNYNITVYIIGLFLVYNLIAIKAVYKMNWYNTVLRSTLNLLVYFLLLFIVVFAFLSYLISNVGQEWESIISY